MSDGGEDGAAPAEGRWYEDPEALVAGLRATDSHWANPPEIRGYTDLVELRRGGQGIVYRAWQSSTRRRVAIKVLVDGALASADDLRRFQREIELTAALDHPNIVKVYDSGVTDGGFPYYVMPLVEGVAIDEAHRQAPRDLRRTLSLFVTICDAVMHAHRHGVIHRDLKPDNVLIDADGAAHILDFGLAKLAPAGRGLAGDRPDISRTGQFLGSLPWASPEQLERAPKLVDSRTDVYSLGVILYQVLCGRLPHEPSHDLHGTVDRITTVAPAPLRAIRRDVPGDVETIVLRCLAKAPERRYQTAGDLARDIERYLNGQPIEAKRDHTAYVLGKILVRHKVVTALAASLLLSIVGFAGTMTVLYRRATSAEASARESLEDSRLQTAKATAVRDFLREMLEFGNPDVASGQSMTVRQMLDFTARSLPGRFGGHPELEAEVRSVLGAAYYALGHLDESEVHARRAVELLTEVHGARHPAVAAKTKDLAVTLMDRHRFAEAEAMLREALEIATTQLGEQDVQVADCLVNLAALAQAGFRFDAADAQYARAHEIYERSVGLGDRRTIAALIQWASLLVILGRLPAAEEKLEHALEPLRAHPDENGPARCGALLALCIVKFNMRELDAAEQALRAAIDEQRRVFGDDHPRLSDMYNYMGHLRRDQGRPAEAERWYRDSLEVCERLVGRRSPQGASALWNLAMSRWLQDDLDGAEPLFREAIAIRGEVLQPDHHLVQASLATFAGLLEQAGRWQAAQPLLERVVDLRVAHYGEEHELTAAARTHLGDCLRGLGRFAESERLLVDAHAVLAAGRDARHRADVLAALVRLYTEWGKQEQAERYRALLPASGGDPETARRLPPR